MTIDLQRRGRVARMTIDAPPLNILDLATLEELDHRLASLEGDAELQVLVLEGAGDRAFSAGVSIQDHVAERIGPTLGTFHRAVRRLRSSPVVSIAAVHGHCLGGGLELAVCCDLVVATDTSRFGTPEIRLGCFPPVAAALFPRRMGAHRALELVLSGRILEAEEAERLGLVNRVVPPGELDAAVTALVESITAHSAAATRLAKQAVLHGEDEPFDEALAAAERLYLDDLTQTTDMKEGIDAFLEKRRPEWNHR